MKFCIYRIRHRETGRSYYGMTCDVENRWKMHRTRDTEGKYLGAALRAHGADAFDWDVLELFQSRSEAARAELRVLREAEARGEPLYNLRLPSDQKGLQNFAWGKKMPWIEYENDPCKIEDDGGDFFPGG